MVGDLDILIDVEKKEMDNDEYLRRTDIERNLCKSTTYLDWFFYPYSRVIRKLKNRSRTLSLHKMDEKPHIGECKRVFKGE